MPGPLQKRLHHAMKVRDVDQDDLAKAAKVTQQAISALLNGDAQRNKHILDIAKALRVRAEWLQDGAGPMEPRGDPGGDSDDPSELSTGNTGNLNDSGDQNDQSWGDKSKLDTPKRGTMERVLIYIGKIEQRLETLEKEHQRHLESHELGSHPHKDRKRTS